MTTFTKASGNEAPVIEVNAERKLSKIDPMVYGGFTEYVQETHCDPTQWRRQSGRKGGGNADQ